MNIPAHKSWDVIDSSKIKTFLDCPRKYFYNYVLGWQPEAESIHLIFGQAWHLAMATLLEEGYGAESILKAYNAFEAHYRESFPDPNLDDGYAPKIPANVLRALPQYAARYRDDKFDVLYTEVAGTVPVDAGRVLHFRLDSVCRDERDGIFCLEHKTVGRISNGWADAWSNSLQVGTYTHVLYCLYDKPDVFGVYINGACIRNAPRMKKDGTPYASDLDNEFLRVPVRRTPDMMQVWLWNILQHMDMIEWNMDRLLQECRDEDPVMMAFPMNTESCTKYGRCPYFDLCTSWANPLHRCDAPPVGFKQEYWDPREEERTAKKVVHLEKGEA